MATEDRGVCNMPIKRRTAKSAMLREDPLTTEEQEEVIDELKSTANIDSKFYRQVRS
jgi:hypothetical protein